MDFEESLEGKTFINVEDGEEDCFEHNEREVMSLP